MVPLVCATERGRERARGAAAAAELQRWTELPPRRRRSHRRRRRRRRSLQPFTGRRSASRRGFSAVTGSSVLLPAPLPRSPCSPPPPRPIPPSRPPPLPPPPGPQAPAAVSQSQSSVGAPKNVVARGRSRRSRAGHTQRTIVRRSVGRHARRWDVVFCRRRRDTWKGQRRSCRRRAARRPALQPAPRAATAPDRSRSARSAVKGRAAGLTSGG